MTSLCVWRIEDHAAVLIGEISSEPIQFRYSADYLLKPGARAISLSLPLREDPYDEAALSPYFNGLLPENEARTAIANALHTTPDDFLTLLLNCGREIIGDVAITGGEAPTIASEYEPLSSDDLDAVFAGFSSLAEANRESRLSLAGSQGKTGLAHLPGKPFDEGWLKPIGGAASTHVLKVSSLEDIPFLEYLCLKAASRIGIRVPEVELFNAARPVFCIERFDRTSRLGNDKLTVSRRHQEDLAQAFGVAARAKYAELAPTTASAITQLLRARSSNPVGDLSEFVKISLFNYLIGNCDNHLKNLSLLYGESWSSFHLAPAYDLVSTTRYERFSTNMGMNVNGKREISEINAADWIAFSREIGVHPDETREFAQLLVDKTPAALSWAAGTHRDFPELDWLAENLCEEMHDRWKVLEEVAQGA